MQSLNSLKRIAEEGLALLEKKPEVRQAEVFAASNALNTYRICYASNVPSNCLEEPKSQESFGLGVRILFKDKKIGFGRADSALDKAAVELAFLRAKKGAVLDKDFRSLPEPSKRPKTKVKADKKILVLDEEKAIELAYASLDSCLGVLEKKYKGELNITGELDTLAERIAIANSNSISEYDENSVAWQALTTILEEKKEDVSGMWFSASPLLKGLSSEKVGMESAEKALGLRHGTKIESGNYKVVLGRMAVSELFSNIFDARLSSVNSKSTPFQGDLDKKIAPEFFNVSDNGNLDGAIGSKKVTDEGLPTGRTQIIRNGRLVNFASNDYYARKFARTERDKRYVPANGFRSGGGGRHYESQPGVEYSNLVIGTGDKNHEELIAETKNGIYIGRIWYCYGVNGSTSSDFTSTIRGDSWIIRNGELARPLTPNTCRISDSLHSVLRNISALGKKQEPTLIWGSDSVIFTPEIAVSKLRIERIARQLY